MLLECKRREETGGGQFAEGVHLTGVAPFEVTTSACIASPERQSVSLLDAVKAETLVMLFVEVIPSPFVRGEAIS